MHLTGLRDIPVELLKSIARYQGSRKIYFVHIRMIMSP